MEYHQLLVFSWSSSTFKDFIWVSLISESNFISSSYDLPSASSYVRINCPAHFPVFPFTYMRRLPWDKSPASMVPKNAVSFELNSSAFKLTLALYILSLPRRINDNITNLNLFLYSAITFQYLFKTDHHFQHFKWFYNIIFCTVF